jgi:uncharacterized cofD-like protein
MKKPNVVVIGGGTGSYIVLSGLKKYPLKISAIVSMMDSGGSTGRLRDQLGVLPPGDLRQALVALSESDEIWRSLFTYRFDHGDLDGHNFGNLFLSSLEKITGSMNKALILASRILKVKGSVIPVTFTDSVLCAKYSDGSVLEGERLIDESYTTRPRILYMYLDPEATLNPKARTAIEKADFIIFGPGDLYTSIIPNILVNGFNEAIKASNAKKIFFINLMTKLGQTDRYKASDFVKELGRYLGGVAFDYIVVNKKLPSREILEWYKRSGNVDDVKDDLDVKKYPGTKIIKCDLLSEVKYEQSLSDRIQRSLIRHDPEKVANVLMDLIRR